MLRWKRRKFFAKGDSSSEDLTSLEPLPCVSSPTQAHLQQSLRGLPLNVCAGFDSHHRRSACAGNGTGNALISESEPERVEAFSSTLQPWTPSPLKRCPSSTRVRGRDVEPKLDPEVVARLATTLSALAGDCEAQPNVDFAIALMCFLELLPGDYAGVVARATAHKAFVLRDGQAATPIAGLADNHPFLSAVFKDRTAPEHVLPGNWRRVVVCNAFS